MSALCAYDLTHRNVTSGSLAADSPDMRALVRGERSATIGVMAGLVGVLCLLVASLVLTLDYRHQLVTVRETIYHRCLQRQIYDQSAHDAVVANERLYQALVDIAHENPVPPGTDPKVVELYNRQVAALERAQLQASQAANAGVLGKCSVYR